MRDGFLRKANTKPSSKKSAIEKLKLIIEASKSIEEDTVNPKELTFLNSTQPLGWQDLYNIKPYKQVTVKELRCNSPTFTTAG